MLTRLKRSGWGRMLYRLSKRRRLGVPLRAAKAIVGHQIWNPAHYQAANIKHNRRQRQTLAAFEAQIRTGYTSAGQPRDT